MKKTLILERAAFLDDIDGTSSMLSRRKSKDGIKYTNGFGTLKWKSKNIIVSKNEE